MIDLTQALTFTKAAGSVMNISGFGFFNTNGSSPTPPTPAYLHLSAFNSSVTTYNFALSITFSEPTDIVIDWGDSTTNNYTAETIVNATHTYAANLNPYDIVISGVGVGKITGIFNNANLISINWDELVYDIGTINFSYGRLVSYGRTLPFTQLLSLLITYNGATFTTFNPASALPNTLNNLQLHHNKLSSFNPTLPLPNSIQFLDIGNNDITTFNPTNALPSSLLQLNLYSLKLETFNPTLPLPSNLQSLDINANLLAEFNPTLPLPNTINYLKLSGNALDEFNPTNSLPTSLQTLLLRDNKLTGFAPTLPLPAVLNNLDLSLNLMDSNAVNATLVYLDAATFNTGTKVLDIRQTPAAPPSGAGLTAIANLQSKGWVIYYDGQPPLGFNFTWNAIVGETYGIQANSTTPMNITIYWGDGTNTTYLGTALNVTKTYSSNGNYFVNIVGTFDATAINLAVNSNHVNYIDYSKLPASLISLSTYDKLTTFNPSVALPINLNQLDLSNNQLTSFNPSIALPDNVNSLSLASNQLTIFNPYTELPDNLYELYLNNNRLITFNTNTALPANLNYLALNHNQLTSFNPIIALPANLNYLALNDNQLTSFNPSIALPSNLAALNLSSNQITIFNPIIALPANLSYLDLSYNQLTTFNPSIALPANLVNLDLSSNQLTEFNGTGFLNNNLLSLYLFNNKITLFDISNLLSLSNSLTTLDLSTNLLVSFDLAYPFDFNFRNLYLNKNFITTFNPLINIFIAGIIDVLDLSENDLDTNSLNNALIYLDTNLTNYSGSISLSAQKSGDSPSSAGLIAKASLEAKGYTVFTD